MKRGRWVRTPQGIGIVERIEGHGVIWVEVAYGRVEPFKSTYVEPIGMSAKSPSVAMR